MVNISWSDTKSLFDEGVPFRKFSIDSGYYIVLQDGMAVYSCSIFGADKTEYDSDYASIERKAHIYDEFGLEVISPSLDDVRGFYPKKQMYKETVIAGQVNIFDHAVSVEKRICGGEYWIPDSDTSKVHVDDFIEFSIVDKNDVLGLFTQYGLVVGVDVLELSKFVINDYVKKGNAAEGYHSQLWEGIKGTNKVIAGLFYRVAYDSSGANNLGFLWRIYYYE